MNDLEIKKGSSPGRKTVMILIFVVVIAIITSFFDIGKKSIALKNQIGSWLNEAEKKVNGEE